jgi:hypothetical protein
VIDLNAWHHAIHQVTGDMAVRFNRATVKDLQRWIHKLRAVAEQMEGQIQRAATRSHLLQCDILRYMRCIGISQLG